MSEQMNVELDDRGVMRIVFNRPETLNALLPEMLTELAETVNGAKAKGARVITIEGEGRAFTAGIDLKALRGETPKAGKISQVFDGPGVAASTALRNAGIPVIAKIHGACFTGGLELALSCDMCFATKDAKFGETHAKFGLRPTWGMSQTLSDAIGIRRAKELSFTARIFRGDEAERWGIVNSLCEDKAELDALVDKRVEQILSCSQGSIEAYVDLYDYAAEPSGREEGIETVYARHYPNISDEDTAERLAQFM
ncbi:MAG: enoyl-CoA hydratase/isomerase family protein [Maricaulaceae bacterium]